MKKRKKTPTVLRATQISSALLGISSMMLSPTELGAYCQDRPDRVNTGYCTIDPDYHNGDYFCKPGGFTCDGDDIY